jgi:DNA topoisomerase-1
MKLLIVESPTKCSGIRRILNAHEPGQWMVIATAGRWRGLPEMAGNEFTDVVDPARGFAETFVVDPAKKDIEVRLREAINGATEVFIATDDDREGEAVAWHISENFRLDKTRRVRFREVTPRSVISGIRNAGSLDMALVDAQRARTVIDYLIGMEVSRSVWRFGCKSAGRLQSCALRILSERERARESFNMEKSWTLRVDYKGGLSAVLGDLQTATEEERRRDTAAGSQPILVPKRFLDHTEAVEFGRKLEQAEHVVADVASFSESRFPPPPLTASELLAQAAASFGLSSDKTASLAQSLFEKGVITHPRTDSTVLADDAVVDIRSYLGAHHPNLFPDEPIGTPLASSGRIVHEAIRPTKMTQVPKSELSLEEHAIYELVFLRALCSQALPAEVECTTVTIRRPWPSFTTSSSHAPTARQPPSASSERNIPTCSADCSKGWHRPRAQQSRVGPPSSDEGRRSGRAGFYQADGDLKHGRRG